jgi:cyanate permease
LGGFIFPLLITALISSVGWRMAWVALGGIVIIGGSLFGAYILVRNKPEDIGQVPDGIPPRSVEDLKTIDYLSEVTDTQVGWSTKQALKQPATWLIAAFTAANLFGFQTMSAHQVAYMQDSGFSPMVSAMSLSVLSITAIIGSLIFGSLALKIQQYKLTSAFFLVRLIALGILLTTDSLFFIYVYAILFGISAGAVISAMPIMMGAYYGRANYAQIMGFLFALQTLAGAAGPAAAGAIYDATSSYNLAFFIITGASLAGLVSAFQARQPKLPEMQG